jgi:hypothetical protein
MPPTCSSPVPVSTTFVASLADGGNFSCDRVPEAPPVKNAAHLHAGENVEVEWSMELEDGAGVAPLSLSTGNASLDYNLGMLGGSYCVVFQYRMKR